MTANGVLSAATIAALNRPTRDAVCLPNEAYLDPAILALERQRIFADGWAWAASAAELPNPGDALPVTLTGLPILLVRQPDGSIAGFHNVCRHRGMRLVGEKQERRRALVCRYHSWTYGLDGKLQRTPCFGGPTSHEHDFDTATMGLEPVRVGTWHDLVFVNLSGNAAPLAQHLAPLDRRWADWELGRLRHGASCTFELKANWKLAVENFLESYHLPFAHPMLNAASRMEDHYSMVEEAYLGQGSVAYDCDAAGHGALPKFPGLSPAQQHVAEYPTLFPNLMLGLHPDYFFTFAVEPVAPDRTLETFHFYYVGEAATARELAPARDRVVEFWRKTNLEDMDVVEGMQEGRLSPGYHDGRFSPYHEVTTHEFQRRIANRLVGNRPPAG